MSAVLTDLQEEIAARLRGDALFATVPVLSERPRDLGYEVDRAVGALGLAIIVSPPGPAGYSATGRPARFEDITVLIRVIEDPVLNEEGPDGQSAAERVLALLHRHRPESVASAMHAAADPVRIVVEERLVVREVTLSTAEPSPA
ncbi:MAG: hypothetical protein AAGK14_01625 [Verrucomicrobiota bacterium]